MIASSTNGIHDFVITLNAPDEQLPSSDKGGKVIGKVGIWRAENNEIGYMLHRDHWGKGYMTEAMAVLFPYLWKRGVPRVVADVDPRNDGSIRLLQKFGFMETGRQSRTGEIGGVWYDSVYFALERPEDEKC